MMTLTLGLTAHQEAALMAKAKAEGVSAEEYVQLMVDRDLEEPLARPGSERTTATPLQTAADIVRSHMGKVPSEVMAAMPSDGASQHDHYIYGWPKKSE